MIKLLVLRSPRLFIARPEQDWQEDHEESVSSQVGCEGEIGVQQRCSYQLLHPGESWCLRPNEWQHGLADNIPPFWQCCSIWFSVSGATIKRSWSRLAYNGRNAVCQRHTVFESWSLGSMKLAILTPSLSDKSRDWLFECSI
jgi:hypothetical protein